MGPDYSLGTDKDSSGQRLFILHWLGFPPRVQKWFLLRRTLRARRSSLTILSYLLFHILGIDHPASIEAKMQRDRRISISSCWELIDISEPLASTSDSDRESSIGGTPPYKTDLHSTGAKKSREATPTIDIKEDVSSATARGNFRQSISISSETCQQALHECNLKSSMIHLPERGNEYQHTISPSSSSCLSSSSIFTNYDKQTQVPEQVQILKRNRESKEPPQAVLYTISLDERSSVRNFLDDYVGRLRVEPCALLLVDIKSDTFAGCLMITLSWCKDGNNGDQNAGHDRDPQSQSMFDGETVSLYSSSVGQTYADGQQILIPSNHEPWEIMQCLLKQSMIRLSPAQPEGSLEAILVTEAQNQASQRVFQPTMARSLSLQ
ncbi:hypothetical protein EJ08DRAFT_385164 [Tothia fuscella]|uniref:Uncharacterized protein n=1 Tax=Tothia fuscella TaxID=1048955 RepID=A0A9P4TW60_9PEZI|nr:hypothetical protein EJ08DRAFT_385164 [Tothia fuscella]